MILSLESFQFWLYFAYFFIAVFVTCVIPAMVILPRKISRDPVLLAGIGLPVGLALWAWQGYILGSLGIRWASYIYLIVFTALWLRMLAKGRNFPSLKQTLSAFTADRMTLFLIFSGAILQVSKLFLTAVRIGGRVWFCCGNLSDNFWFAGVSQELVRHFPPEQPAMSGVLLTNYHYWSNLAIADLSRVFGIPVLAVQFQFISVLTAILLGLTAVAFARIHKLSPSFLRWLVFFLYFGGDAIYWILFLLSGRIDFSMSAMETGMTFLVNMPRAVAVVVFMGVVNLLSLFITESSLRTGFLIALTMTSLIGMKIYVAIFALAGLGVLGLTDLVKRRRVEVMGLFLLSALISLAIYLPTNSGAGGLYFTGFWRFENFIVQPALHLERLDMARAIFKEAGKWYRAYAYDFLFAVVYVAAIFGTKIIGFLQTRKTMGRLPWQIHVFLLTGLAVSAGAGFFFQQSINAGNTFNFLVNVFIIGSVYTALAASGITASLKSPLLRIAAVVAIIILTVPRTIDEARSTLRIIRNRSTYILDNDIDRAAMYVRANVPEDALFMVHWKGYHFETTSSLLKMLTDRPVYYSGNTILTDAQTPSADRLKNLSIVFGSKSASASARILKMTGTDYVWVATTSAFKYPEYGEFLDPVFERDFAMIYRVNRDRMARYLQSLDTKNR